MNLFNLFNLYLIIYRYVKVYLLPDRTKSGKRKTKVKKHTLNPVFEEVLKFYMTISEIETRTLWLSVWHSDMFGRNDFLGEVTLPLGHEVFENPGLKWYPLQERVRNQQFANKQFIHPILFIYSLKFLKMVWAITKVISFWLWNTSHLTVDVPKNLVQTKENFMYYLKKLIIWHQQDLMGHQILFAKGNQSSDNWINLISFSFYSISTH